MAKAKRVYADNIITLDIETTSLIYNNGSWTSFDFRIDKKELLTMQKVGIMYKWGSIFNDIYTTKSDIKDLFSYLQSLTLKDEIQVIYCHNLGFEFQFLRNIIDDFEVFARKGRKPLKAFSKSLNIEFRCSYNLTGYSLKKCADIYSDPDVKKAVGDLDYKLNRHYNTPLNSKEKNYLFIDNLIVKNIIESHLKEYGSIKKIPLTQTGKVRNEISKRLSRTEKKKIASLLPTNFSDFKMLLDAFSGGYTHANALYTDTVVLNVFSFDIVSAYPTEMITRRFPMSKFFNCDLQKFDIKQVNKNEKIGHLLTLTFFNIKSNNFNNYISVSKCNNVKGSSVDNGRVAFAKELTITITSIDYDIIIKNYTFEKLEVIKAMYCFMDYLPKTYCNFIIELFLKKQKLKDVIGKEEEYRKAKEFLNALYGMCVTNVVRDEVTFTGNEWGIKHLTLEDVNDTLVKNASKIDKVVSSYAWGVWTTAYTRQKLWFMINKLNDKNVYDDTDSIKGVDISIKDFDVINAKSKYLLKSAMERLECKEDLQNLGEFEKDGEYIQFTTLGAKKYIYEYFDKKKQKNSLAITVSGVNKNGVKALKSINDFKKGFVWTYSTSGKNSLYYNDEQPPISFNDYMGNNGVINNQPFGICVLPETYTLGTTEEYEEIFFAVQQRQSTALSLLGKEQQQQTLINARG